MISREALVLAAAAALISAGFAERLSLSSTGSGLFSAATQVAVAAPPGQQVAVFEMPSGMLQGSYPPSGPVAAVAAGQGGAAWVAQMGERWELSVRLPSGVLVRSLVPQDIPVSRLAWLGRSVAVLDDQGGDVFDPVTQNWIDPEAVLPPAAAAIFDQSYIQSSPNGLVAMVRPFRLATVGAARRTMSAVTMFHALGGAWRELGTAVTFAPRYREIKGSKFDNQGRFTDSQFSMSATRIALDDLGFVALEDDVVLRVPFLRGVWQPDRKPVLGPPPAWSEQIGASGGRLFRLSSNRLISQDLETGELASYLPWNLKGTLQGLQSDGQSLWAMTTEGPRQIQGGQADDQGFGGFVRSSMSVGDLSLEQQRLRGELESWIGTPYVLGGNTKQGVDCSGLVVQAFLTVGVSLPRTSSLIRTTNQGEIIKDELQVGDVICTPGHVAVYVGKGETIEAVRGGVRRMTIWRFKDVTVRRFIGLNTSRRLE